jgi:hypothetical protein
MVRLPITPMSLGRNIPYPNRNRHTEIGHDIQRDDAGMNFRDLGRVGWACIPMPNNSGPGHRAAFGYSHRPLVSDRWNVGQGSAYAQPTKLEGHQF